MGMFRGASQITDHFTIIINEGNFIFGFQVSHADAFEEFPASWSFSVYLWCFVFVYSSSKFVRYGTGGSDSFKEESK